MRALVLIGLVAGAVACGGCARKVESPPPLKLGYTPAEDMVADRGDAARALAAYLARALGRPVEVVRTSSYGPAIEAMARAEVDFMSLGPFAYVQAHREGVAEAIAVTGRPDTGPRTYRSAIIANRKTGLTSLEELRAVAGRMRFNFTDPSSNSGHLVPSVRLAAFGIDAEQDFLSSECTRSHAVSILNVVHGAADVAGVSDSVLRRLSDKERIRSHDLQVLWRSAPMPTGPMAVRSGLPAEIKSALRDALVALPQADPVALRAVMKGMPEPDSHFLPAEHSLYAELEELAERAYPDTARAAVGETREAGSRRYTRRPSTQDPRTRAW